MKRLLITGAALAAFTAPAFAACPSGHVSAQKMTPKATTDTAAPTVTPAETKDVAVATETAKPAEQPVVNR